MNNKSKNEAKTIAMAKNLDKRRRTKLNNELYKMDSWVEIIYRLYIKKKNAVFSRRRLHPRQAAVWT